MLFWQVSPGPSSGRLTGKSSIGSLAGGWIMDIRNIVHISKFGNILNQFLGHKSNLCNIVVAKSVFILTTTAGHVWGLPCSFTTCSTLHRLGLYDISTYLLMQFFDQGKSRICFAVRKRNQIPGRVLGLLSDQ